MDTKYTVKGVCLMKTQHVLLPKIEVYITQTEFGNVYSLLINDNYDATYSNLHDVYSRIELLTKTAFSGKV